jgi:hypothetical protein
MPEPRAAQARQQLAQSAATLLGQVIFEFSRLELDLGLFVVWTNNGRDLESLTQRFNESTFHEKLRFLERTVSELAPASAARDAYNAWIQAADAARMLRNGLVHGRWGFDLATGDVINVVGLPTSIDQRATRFELKDLESGVRELIALRERLDDLRTRWPL